MNNTSGDARKKMNCNKENVLSQKIEKSSKRDTAPPFVSADL